MHAYLFLRVRSYLFNARVGVSDACLCVLCVCCLFTMHLWVCPWHCHDRAMATPWPIQAFSEECNIDCLHFQNGVLHELTCHMWENKFPIHVEVGWPYFRIEPYQNSDRHFDQQQIWSHQSLIPQKWNLPHSTHTHVHKTESLFLHKAQGSGNDSNARAPTAVFKLYSGRLRGQMQPGGKRDQNLCVFCML